jgi:hypothetical protein
MAVTRHKHNRMGLKEPCTMLSMSTLHLHETVKRDKYMKSVCLQYCQTNLASTLGRQALGWGWFWWPPRLRKDIWSGRGLWGNANSWFHFGTGGPCLPFNSRSRGENVINIIWLSFSSRGWARWRSGTMSENCHGGSHFLLMDFRERLHDCGHVTAMDHWNRLTPGSLST